MSLSLTASWHFIQMECNSGRALLARWRLRHCSRLTCGRLPCPRVALLASPGGPGRTAGTLSKGPGDLRDVTGMEARRPVFDLCSHDLEEIGFGLRAAPQGGPSHFILAGKPTPVSDL